MERDLLLASASPARAAMLKNAGVPVEAEAAHIDEAAVKAALLAEAAPPRDIADTLAEMKAQKIARRRPGRIVLGADQILVHDGKIFDKPQDQSQAADHLRALRGSTHHLISAAVIYEDDKPVWRHVGTARLTMRDFSDAFLSDYIAREGDGLTATVGAYRLEGYGAQLFSQVSGDYFSVLGLPLLEVLDFLRSRRVIDA